MSIFKSSRTANPTTDYTGVNITPGEPRSSADKALFTIISSFNPVYLKKRGLQSAVNSDPNKSVCITDDVKSIPRDELLCILPYEIKDKNATITNSNFVKSSWVAVDIDNNKVDDDKKWSQNEIFNHFAKKDYNFHIFGSPTPGNYKVYIECELCDNFHKYSQFTKAINTETEGLGDYKYQGRVTIVKNYLCGYRGKTLFTADTIENKATVSNNAYDGSGNGKENNNATERQCGSKMSIYSRKIKDTFIGKNSIRGKVLNAIARQNGTITLLLENEKSKGGYYIRPERGIFIYKAGGGKWTPQEFFIDDTEQKIIYKLMLEIGKLDSRLNMLNEVNESVAQDEMSKRKITLTRELEKNGAVKKISYKNGLRRVYFLYKQVRYFLDNILEIKKILKLLWNKLFSSSFNFSKTSSCVLKKYNYSFYKGRSEEEIENDHKKIINAIQLMRDKAKQLLCSEEKEEKEVDYHEIRQKALKDQAFQDRWRNGTEMTDDEELEWARDEAKRMREELGCV